MTHSGRIRVRLGHGSLLVLTSKVSKSRSCCDCFTLPVNVAHVANLALSLGLGPGPAEM